MGSHPGISTSCPRAIYIKKICPCVWFCHNSVWKNQYWGSSSFPVPLLPDGCLLLTEGEAPTAGHGEGLGAAGQGADSVSRAQA